MPHETTYLGKEISQIDPSHLITLDDELEDANEILAFMQSQDEEGKPVFANPNVGNSLYSPSAIATLREHPVTRDFVLANDAKIQRLQQIQLPPEFYDALHRYLLQLHKIGHNPDETIPFHFTTAEKIERCQTAKCEFFDWINKNCSVEIKADLEEIIISVPMRGGADSEVKFSKLARGEGELDCVITQQIYLWGMLRSKRPETAVPNELLKQPQARNFNLGELPADMVASPGEMMVIASLRDEIERLQGERERLEGIVRGNAPSGNRASLFQLPITLKGQTLSALRAIEMAYTGPHTQHTDLIKDIFSLPDAADKTAIMGKINPLLGIRSKLGFTSRLKNALEVLYTSLKNDAPINDTLRDRLVTIVNTPRTSFKDHFKFR